MELLMDEVKQTAFNLKVQPSQDPRQIRTRKVTILNRANALPLFLTKIIYLSISIQCLLLNYYN